jgi:hypothetical protein
MIPRGWLGLAVVACISIAGPAVAVPITYNETINGDLAFARDGTPLTTLTLGAGANTIAGTETFRNATQSSPQILDSDGFRFVLGPSLRLDTITMAYSFAGLGSPNVYCQQWALRTEGHAELAIQTPDPIGNCATAAQVTLGEIFPSGASIFGNALPLVNGTFEIVGRGGQFGPTGGAMSYLFTLGVTDTSVQEPTQVPEPGSLVLSMLGLAGLSFTRRRMRSVT